MAITVTPTPASPGVQCAFGPLSASATGNSAARGRGSGPGPGNNYVPCKTPKQQQKSTVSAPIDLLTRTSWTDARIALAQINKGKATGNKSALWLRAKLQLHLYALGCFIQNHAGKVLFVGLLVLSTFCVGLKSARLQTNVEELWVEEGGRLEQEMEYIRKTLGDGYGLTNQMVVQTARQEGTNLMHVDAIQAHLSTVMAATRVTVEMFDITWRLKDVCNTLSAPSFDEHYIDQILSSVLPCVIVTPLDCFWEGARVLGPDVPVTMPGVSNGVKWTELNPQSLLNTMKTMFTFQYDTLEDLMKRAGIGTAYQEKPCLDPLDPECPETAPNKRSAQVPDVGAELSGGCYGFATKYMHWPEELIVGGTKKNKTGHIVRGEALQTVIQLMGEKELYEFWQDNYKVHNMDWTQEKARSVLHAWQRKFTENVASHVMTANETDAYNIHAFSATSMMDILEEFSEVSTFKVALGYVLTVIYAFVSLMRWTDMVNSQSGVGMVGVLLVAISVAAGLGFCAVLGIMFNATTTQIVPFLALGLGVDDMFLLAHTYSESSVSEIPIEEQTGECLKRTGMSVLLTSFSNMGAFFAAAIIPVPALRAFALQAAILVIFNAAAMLLVFPAVVSLDLRRREAKRADVFCCFAAGRGGSSDAVVAFRGCEITDGGATKRKPSGTEKEARTVTVLAPSMESLDATTTASTRDLVDDSNKDSCHRRRIWARCTGHECSAKSIAWFAREYYGPWLLRTPVKVLTVVLFLALTAASVWGLLKVSDGLDLTEVVPHGSQEYRFLSAQSKYFGFYNMFAVTQGNFEYPTNQRLLYEYHTAFTRVGKIVKDDDGGLPTFWLSLFKDWLVGLQKAFDRDWTDGCVTQERWFANASDEAILAYKLLVQTGHVDNPIDKSLVTQVRLVDSEGIINPKAFYNYLSAWASNDALAYSASQGDLRPEPRQWFHDAQDVELKIPKSQPLVYAQMPFYLNDLGDTVHITETIKAVRAVCRRFEERGLPNFPTGIPFNFWEQYLALRMYMLLALAAALAAVFLVVATLLVNPWAAAVLVSTLAALVAQLFGFMGVVGVRLSAVPAVVLIVAVGIGVEFTVHICVGYLTSVGSRDRRVSMSLEQMVAPVVHGAVSTFLGVGMLAFSEFDFVVKYFFCVLSALVVLGLLNGLVVLPVLLSLVGPAAEVIPRDDPDRISTPTPEPSPAPRQRSRSRNSGLKSAFHKRVHPKMNSEISLTTITEEPPSWHSSHEIVVQPEVVVETTTYPSAPEAKPSPSSSSSSSCSSSSPSSSSTSSADGTPIQHKLPSSSTTHSVTTTVTATTRVKVAVHTPLPGAVESSRSFKHKRRRETDVDSDSSGK